MLRVGDRAPDFELPSYDGSTFRLKDHRGKKIVLYFYPKDHTSGCTKEACSFRDNYDSFRKKDALIVGISADSSASHTSFAKKNNLPFLLLSDEDKKVLKLYGVWKKKQMYGRTFYGIERTTFVIDEEGIIRRIFTKVKVNGHSEEVLASLLEE